MFLGSQKEIIQKALENFNPEFLYHDTLPSIFSARIEALKNFKGISITTIERSRSGKYPIYGLVLGDEKKPTITLTGNCHPEEVIGSLTILSVIENILSGGSLSFLYDYVRIVAIPQMNPDGVVKNYAWLNEPGPSKYFAYLFRDHRNEDIEHGIAIGSEKFSRPEPQALKEFYEKEAIGRTIFYTSLHSCNMQPGAYFLTGNEDQQIMGEAWSIIRELAPGIGMLLRTENLNGYKNFRKISDGVYSVPRRKEMAESLKSAGAMTMGFLTNSLEWMESQGCPISLVSEVPTVGSSLYTEKLIAGLPAIALIAPVIPIYKSHEAKKEQLLSDLNGKLRNLVCDEEKLRCYTEQFYLQGKESENQMRFLHTFVGNIAFKKHELDLAVLPYKLDLILAGIALSVLNISPEREMWFERYLLASSAFEKILNPYMIPISVQIKLQTLLLLAGTFAGLQHI